MIMSETSCYRTTRRVDLAEGIPEYINMLEDAQRKLARAQLPMGDRQLLAIASTAVLAAQHFPRATD